jgi:hypothetical protein
MINKYANKKGRYVREESRKHAIKKLKKNGERKN